MPLQLPQTPKPLGPRMQIDHTSPTSREQSKKTSPSLQSTHPEALPSSSHPPHILRLRPPNISVPTKSQTQQRRTKHHVRRRRDHSKAKKAPPTNPRPTHPHNREARAGRILPQHIRGDQHFQKRSNNDRQALGEQPRTPSAARTAAGGGLSKRDRRCLVQIREERPGASVREIWDAAGVTGVGVRTVGGFLRGVERERKRIKRDGVIQKGFSPARILTCGRPGNGVTLL